MAEKACASAGQNDKSREGKTRYRIKAVHSSETYLSSFETVLEKDAMVMFSSSYGTDLGRVLGEVLCPLKEDDGSNVSIVRIANEKDLEIFEKNLGREKEALGICREKVQKHELDMKLVSAHYLNEESKLLFFFTAENRVDFRELVKDLVSVFKMRIELRQIGVRDESRVVGGSAVCGRMYCCHGISDKLNAVSIKMAKEQNLSLNSLKISGPCGRLLCCLSYEYDFYREEKRRYPAEGSRIQSGNINYKVLEVNILAKNIRLLSSEGGVVDVPASSFSYDSEKKKWSVQAIEI